MDTPSPVILNGARTLLVIVLSVVLVRSLIHLWTYWTAPSASPLKNVPGPPVKHWFFGFLTPEESQTFQMSPKLLEYCAQYRGTWASTFTNRKPTLVLGDLNGIHHVLNDGRTYARAEAQMRTTRLIFGDGLVGVDGAQHARQRKVVGPGLSAAAVDDMVPVFVQVSRELSTRWKAKLQDKCNGASKAPSGQTLIDLNIYSEFEKLSLDIIGKTGFNYDFKSLEGGRTELEAAFVNVTKAAATGSLYSILRSNFGIVGRLGRWFSKEQMTLDRLKAHILTISSQLVDKARAETQGPSTGKGAQRRRDILGLLVQADRAENVKNRLGDDEIKSMIPTILSGGYDNNASVMSYAAYGLARNPETQRRMRQELKNPPRGCEDWQENPKSLEKLPYLDAVCRETLRLYSSAHSIPRTATRHDQIPLSKKIQLQDGSFVDHIQVAPGDDIVVPQKWMNVDPELWGSDADTFKPERWIQDRDHQHYDGGLSSSIQDVKHSGWSRLMTFSIGPRNCIGYRMAVAEFKACMAVLTLEFEFLEHAGMESVFGEVQIVDRPRVPGIEGYCMPCWVRRL